MSLIKVTSLTPKSHLYLCPFRSLRRQHTGAKQVVCGGIEQKSTKWTSVVRERYCKSWLPVTGVLWQWFLLFWISACLFFPQGALYHISKVSSLNLIAGKVSGPKYWKTSWLLRMWQGLKLLIFHVIFNFAESPKVDGSSSDCPCQQLYCSLSSCLMEDLRNFPWNR